MGERVLRIYIDSNVIISYIKSEFGGITVFQANEVKNFFWKCFEKEHVLVLSDLTLFEIKKKVYYSQLELLNLINEFELEYELIKENKEDYEKANQIQRSTKIHYADARHVQLAISSKSDCIITWDLKDFKKVKKLIAVKTPAEFI